MGRLLFSLKWSAFTMVAIVAAMVAFKLLVDGWQAIFGDSSGSMLAMMATLVFVISFVGAWTYPRSPRP